MIRVEDYGEKSFLYFPLNFKVWCQEFSVSRSLRSTETCSDIFYVQIRRDPDENYTVGFPSLRQTRWYYFQTIRIKIQTGRATNKDGVCYGYQ